MGLYGRLADLPVSVDSVSTTRRATDTTGGFARVSTELELHGDGNVGTGEDVTYEAAAHDSLGEWIEDDPNGVIEEITGDQTVDSLAHTLGEQSLTVDGHGNPHTPHYRRWAFESAALDLALRQAGSTLGERLDLSYRPVHFVASPRLSDDGDQPTLAPIKRLRSAVPGLEFKLDPAPNWTAELVQALADTGAVRVLDFKGLYETSEVEGVIDADLYASLVDAFPGTVLEDPGVTEETREIVTQEADRVAWDYPITNRDALAEHLERIGGGYCNVKPSRLGSLESVFDVIEYAWSRDIGLYGGGQFELGVGRGQIQALASLCYPDGPNDVAPRVYNDASAAAPLPSSPLTPREDREPGFGFRETAW